MFSNRIGEKSVAPEESDMTIYWKPGMYGIFGLVLIDEKSCDLHVVYFIALSRLVMIS